MNDELDYVDMKDVKEFNRWLNDVSKNFLNPIKKMEQVISKEEREAYKLVGFGNRNYHKLIAKFRAKVKERYAKFKSA